MDHIAQHIAEQHDTVKEWPALAHTKQVTCPSPNRQKKACASILSLHELVSTRGTTLVHHLRAHLPFRS